MEPVPVSPALASSAAIIARIRDGEWAVIGRPKISADKNSADERASEQASERAALSISIHIASFGVWFSSPV